MGVVALTQAGRLFSRQSPCSLHARPQAARPPEGAHAGQRAGGQAWALQTAGGASQLWH